jgi:hypothetical protein
MEVTTGRMNPGVRDVTRTWIHPAMILPSWSYLT